MEWNPSTFTSTAGLPFKVHMKMNIPFSWRKSPKPQSRHLFILTDLANSKDTSFMDIEVSSHLTNMSFVPLHSFPQSIFIPSIHCLPYTLSLLNSSSSFLLYLPPPISPPSTSPPLLSISLLPSEAQELISPGLSSWLLKAGAWDLWIVVMLGRSRRACFALQGRIFRRSSRNPYLEDGCM